MRRELGRGSPTYYADQQGLYNIVQAMQKFGANPRDCAAFRQPASPLVNLTREGE